MRYGIRAKFRTRGCRTTIACTKDESKLSKTTSFKEFIVQVLLAETRVIAEKVRMVEVSLLGEEELEDDQDVQVSRFEIVRSLDLHFLPAFLSLNLFSLDWSDHDGIFYHLIRSRWFLTRPAQSHIEGDKIVREERGADLHISSTITYGPDGRRVSTYVEELDLAFTAIGMPVRELAHFRPDHPNMGCSVISTPFKKPFILESISLDIFDVITLHLQKKKEKRA